MAKINLKKGILAVILYIIIFIVVQMIVTYAGAGIWAVVKQLGYMSVVNSILMGENPVLLTLTSVFSNVITLVIFLKAKWTVLTRDYLLSKPWVTYGWHSSHWAHPSP